MQNVSKIWLRNQQYPLDTLQSTGSDAKAGSVITVIVLMTLANSEFRFNVYVLI